MYMVYICRILKSDNNIMKTHCLENKIEGQNLSEETYDVDDGQIAPFTTFHLQRINVVHNLSIFHVTQFIRIVPVLRSSVRYLT